MLKDSIRYPYYNFKIPGAVPPSMNKYAGRSNVWEYRADKKTWKDLVFYYSKPMMTRNAIIEPLEYVLIFLGFEFKQNRIQDPDARLKFLLDGLTYSGLIVDDSSKHIAILTDCKHNPDAQEKYNTYIGLFHLPEKDFKNLFSYQWKRVLNGLS